MNKPHREIGSASQLNEHPSIRAFINDVTENGVVDIRTGYPSHHGEDYMTIPAHITTPTCVWEGEFALEIDVLNEDRDDIAKSMVEWLQEEMSNHDDYESGDE